MIKTKFFANKKSTPIEFIIEPMCESFQLLPGQTVKLDFCYKKNSTPMTVDLWDHSVVIFEEVGATLTASIDGVAVYSSL